MEMKTNPNVRMGLLVQGRRATSRLRLRLGGGGGRSARGAACLCELPWDCNHSPGGSATAWAAPLCLPRRFRSRALRGLGAVP